MDCSATHLAHSLFLPTGTCIIVAFFGLDGLGFRVLGFCLHTYARSTAIIASSYALCPSFYCNVLLFITTTISTQYVLSCICPSRCICVLVPECYLIGLAKTVGAKVRLYTTI
jgi:hypothetical protein